VASDAAALARGCGRHSFQLLPTPKYAKGLAIPVWFYFADSDVLFIVDNEVAFVTGA